MSGRAARKLRPADRIRPPCYVDRESGAAELCVAPETWDALVVTGELPPATVHLRSRMPRWRWADVDAWLSGRRPSVDSELRDASNDASVAISPFAAAVMHGQKAQGGRRG